jgi:hypothetical protein
MLGAKLGEGTGEIDFQLSNQLTLSQMKCYLKDVVTVAKFAAKTHTTMSLPPTCLALLD